jgi:probable O-glycosylation ligase (exosortase A-associated)
MNPHRLSWGFAYNFPFSQFVGATLLVSFVLSRDKKRIPITSTTILWFGFIFWISLTTLLAMYPEAAQQAFIRTVKIQLMTFITIALMQSRDRLNALIWVIVVSLGFFGVKGGAFIALTGSNTRLWGPGGFIEDNNALAIALLMTLPLMNYLRLTVSAKWARRALLLAMLLTLLAIVMTYSRAAMLGVLAMAVLSWAKSSKKVITALGVAIIMTGVYYYAPPAWHERMGTITEVNEEGEREGSAQARLDTWKMIINLAKDRPLFGAGFDPWHEETYIRYAEKMKPAHSAHNIYFSVLAEHGFIGLLLFVGVFITAWRTATRTRRYCRDESELTWLAELMAMIQLSLVGFMVAGMFHQLPYFDLPWHLVSITVIGRAIVQSRASEAPDVPEPELVGTGAQDT